MKKKIYLIPYITCTLAIAFSIIIWDYLKLPYDESNLIQGTAFNEKVNPQNNLIRVYFFIFFPVIIFFIFQKIFFNTLSLIPFKKDFFLQKNNYSIFTDKLLIKNLNFLSAFLILLVILEFFSLNFKTLLRPLDIYHEGQSLVPSINFLFLKNFWVSTHYDWGIGANLRSIFAWKLFGHETIGSKRIFDQSLILVNKIVLILICRKISILFSSKNISAIFYFVFLTLSAISLSDYFVSIHGTGGPPFPIRLLPFLLFFLILLDDYKKKSLHFKNFIIGFFSSISFLWYTDIALYINVILVVFLSILLSIKEFKRFYFTLLGILFSWIIFFIIFGKIQVGELFYQIKSNLEFIYYFNFLEFPKPFSEHSDSSRGLKSLTLIVINSIICINLLFKRNHIEFKTKITLLLTLVSSVIIFKSALIRADAPHIKYASGFIFFLFFINIYYLLIFKNKYFEIFLKKINLKNKNLLTFLFIGISLKFLLFNNINLKNILHNINYGIDEIVTKEDEFYLNYKPGMYSYGFKYTAKTYTDDIDFKNYYEELTIRDKCVQNFTEYLAISYYLKKPTCTEFFNPQFIQHNITDKKFLESFKKNLPEYILYESPFIFINKKGEKQQDSLIKGMPNVERFIKKNYIFYEKYLDKWVILKKKQN